jgi:hypothetical protein
LRIEMHDGVRGAIAHVESAASVGGDSFGLLERTEFFFAGQAAAVVLQDHDAAIAGIGDGDAPERSMATSYGCENVPIRCAPVPTRCRSCPFRWKTGVPCWIERDERHLIFASRLRAHARHPIPAGDTM